MNAKEFYEALRTTDIRIVENLTERYLNTGVEPREILNDGLIAAMGIIGKDFKKGELWIPDVLVAARNMNNILELLKPKLTKGDLKPKGKFVIGTVAGDIHDIGKNIVSMVFTTSGYEVIDMGVNVARQRFVEIVEGKKPEVIGISALLTTTMSEIAEVVRILKDKDFEKRPKILVGGAPVTKEFADEIGADGYGENAFSALETAEKLIG